MNITLTEEEIKKISDSLELRFDKTGIYFNGNNYSWYKIDKFRKIMIRDKTILNHVLCRPKFLQL